MTTEYRPYGLWTAIALVVGGMIGSGIFLLPAQLAPFGITAIVSWVMAIMGAMLLAILLGKLASARPHAEGMVPLCADALGPIPGLLIGWSYWVANCATNAAYALGATRYLAVLWPVLGQTMVNTVTTSLIILWSLTLLNLGGARGVGLFQQITTVLKLLPLVAILFVLGYFALQGGHQFHPEWQTAYSSAQLTPALGITFFALLGFEGVSVIAGRVRHPERNIARATALGVAFTGVLYLAISTGIAMTLTPATLGASGAPISLFFSQFIGGRAGSLVALFGAISIIGALNGWILINAELPLGMARDGVLPRALAWTSRREVPVPLLIATTGLSTLMVLAGLLRTTSGLLDTMVLLTTASVLWLFIGCCAAALQMKLARPLALLSLAFSFWVLYGTGWSVIGLSLIPMIPALAFYWLGLRRATEQPT
jgi:APA family basic amino acid/polyamine antiporter